MDEFDHALMEALNESVPPADFATDLVGRLVKRTRRRNRTWKLLLALGLFTAATAAVVTATTLLGGDNPAENDGRRETGDEPGGPRSATAEAETGVTGATLPVANSETLSNTPQGESHMQGITLKKAAALTGAIALSAAQPAAADGYQFIVSGYPAANPSRSDVSSGTSLSVGVLGDVSAADALEARARTSDDSAGTALRSDEYRAMMIIVR